MDTTTHDTVSAVTAPAYLLSDAEIATLGAALAILARVERDATEATFAHVRNHDANGSKLLGLGRIAESMNATGDALGAALINLDVYGQDTRAVERVRQHAAGLASEARA